MTFKYGVWCKIGTYLSFALTIGNIYLCTSVNLALQRVWQAIFNLIDDFFHRILLKIHTYTLIHLLEFYLFFKISHNSI